MSKLSLRLRRRRRPYFRRTAQISPQGPKAADPLATPTTFSALCYSPEKVEEFDAIRLDQVPDLHKHFPVVWIDVVGLADVSLIERIGECFKLHPLALEDVVHTHQRAKVEDYGEHQFIVLRMAPMDGEYDTDQLSMFLGPGCVVTFQERPGDCFGDVRDRIRRSKGRIRSLGADYLAYSILDAAVDAYFPLLERNGEALEELEDDVVVRPDPSVLARVYEIRRKLLILRRAVWPLREAVSVLARDQTPHFTQDTRAYLRDVYDHCIQIIDLMETYRELSSNLMDVYLSSMSNRLNEVMKVLTIITTIFIPLTFIAGVYGMNFHTESSPWNMPELAHRYGYPICIGVMLLIAIAEIIYFRRKGWIGGPKEPNPDKPD
ncbi:MAG: magnesium/cobalt transporter CorA [Candidatus Sumerlaeaceae bacterium]|nr:magnesium/cobalt transporter CorA [Candidatus Sumerlaeaceae bacterium]